MCHRLKGNAYFLGLFLEKLVGEVQLAWIVDPLHTVNTVQKSACSE